MYTGRRLVFDEERSDRAAVDIPAKVEDGGCFFRTPYTCATGLQALNYVFTRRESAPEVVSPSSLLKSPHTVRSRRLNVTHLSSLLVLRIDRLLPARASTTA